MKKNRALLSYLLVVFISVGISFLIVEKQNVKIATVDSVKLLSNYEPLIKLQGEIAQKNKLRQMQLDSIQSSIEADIIKMEKERSQLSKSEAEKKELLIVKKRQEFYRVKELLSNEKTQEDKELTMKIIQPVEKHIKEFAKKNNYDIVFNVSGDLLYIDNAHDITDDLIKDIRSKGKN